MSTISKVGSFLFWGNFLAIAPFVQAESLAETDEVDDSDDDGDQGLEADVRVASLRSGKANLHVGPGLNYPVEWVLVLKHMPVLILSDFHAWRRIKLCDGTVGWVHKSLLCSKKTALVRRSTWLKEASKDSSERLARIGKNVVVYVVKRKIGWVKVLVSAPEDDKLIGWIPEEDLWGLP